MKPYQLTKDCHSCPFIYIIQYTHTTHNTSVTIGIIINNSIIFSHLYFGLVASVQIVVVPFFTISCAGPDIILVTQYFQYCAIIRELLFPFYFCNTQVPTIASVRGSLCGQDVVRSQRACFVCDLGQVPRFPNKIQHSQCLLWG